MEKDILQDALSKEISLPWKGLISDFLLGVFFCQKKNSTFELTISYDMVSLFEATMFWF